LLRRLQTVILLNADGVTKTAAYDHARKILGDGNVEPNTIQSSYKKIQKTMKGAVDHRQLFLVLTRVADRLGIKIPDISV
jgi:hypothetical protein